MASHTRRAAGVPAGRVLPDGRARRPNRPAPRASGTLESHYAPNAKVRLMSAEPIQTALDLLGADAAHIAVYARTILRIQSPNVLYRRMPDDALATAQQLLSVLRGFDGDRVLIMQDGVRTGTLSSQSGDHGEPVDPQSLEGVERVRVPGTWLDGAKRVGRGC